MTKRKTNQRDQKRTVKKNRRTQQSVTIGIDLGDKASRYSVLNSEGEILREVQAATTKAGMLEKFGRSDGLGSPSKSEPILLG